MTFAVGDKVVYPHHGAATIEKREKKEAFGEKRDYLVLRLAYGDLTLMVPADNAEEIGLREVINDEEVEEVFAVLRKKEARMPTNWSRRFKNHVEKLKSGDIYQVAEVVRNLSIREADKGLSAGEKRMLARARQILVSELTFALNVDEETAETRLDEVLKGEDKPPAKKPAAKKAPAAKKQERSAVGAVWGIVVAAGRGDRFGAPKQFCDLAGTRVVDRSVATAAAVCDAVIVVLPDAMEWDGPRVDAAVVGGATRSESVRAGLRAVPDDADVIVVHDAARPLASRELFAAVIAAVRDGADAAVPGVAVADTLKRVDGTQVVTTVARDDLVAAQTPQAFRAGALRTAHEGDDDASDDAALVESAGGRVVVVAGDPANLKITTPTDLVVAAASLS